MLFKIEDANGNLISDILCKECLAESLAEHPLAEGEAVVEFEPDEDINCCQWCCEP